MPAGGQLASVALMDTRSIAATAINGGIVTPATEIPIRETFEAFHFDRRIYDHRVYQGFGKAKAEEELRFDPTLATGLRCSRSMKTCFSTSPLSLTIQ